MRAQPDHGRQPGDLEVLVQDLAHLLAEYARQSTSSRADAPERPLADKETIAPTYLRSALNSSTRGSGEMRAVRHQKRVRSAQERKPVIAASAAKDRRLGGCPSLGIAGPRGRAIGKQLPSPRDARLADQRRARPHRPARPAMSSSL